MKLKKSGTTEAARGSKDGWLRTARIAAGFVVGAMLVWSWQVQSEAATTIVAVAVGTALGVIAFSIGRWR